MRNATRSSSILTGMLSAMLSLTSILFPLEAALAANPSPAPRLSVESAVYNFGTVRQGEKVEHTFKIKNSGNADLLIQRVVPACGCTAAAPSKEKLNPGETTDVKVTFDTRGFSGEKLKTVRVFSNDPDQSSAVLTIQGEIQTDVLIEPARLIFPEIVRGEARNGATQEVVVRVREGASTKLGAAIASSSLLQVTEQPGSTAQSKRLLVRISPDVSPGEFRERVVLPLIDSGSSTAIIPVVATVRGTVELRPVALSFGVLEGKTVIEKSVRVENLSGGPLSVLSVSSDSPAVEAVIAKGNGRGDEPSGGGSKKGIELLVRVDPTKVTEDLRASILVKTSRASEPPLVLGVYGIRPTANTTAHVAQKQ